MLGMVAFIGIFVATYYAYTNETPPPPPSEFE